MDWQLVASYFTVKSTDIFYTVDGNRFFQMYRIDGRAFDFCVIYLQCLRVGLSLSRMEDKRLHSVMYDYAVFFFFGLYVLCFFVVMMAIIPGK